MYAYNTQNNRAYTSIYLESDRIYLEDETPHNSINKTDNYEDILKDINKLDSNLHLELNENQENYLSSELIEPQIKKQVYNKYFNMTVPVGIDKEDISIDKDAIIINSNMIMPYYIKNDIPVKKLRITNDNSGKMFIHYDNQVKKMFILKLYNSINNLTFINYLNETDLQSIKHILQLFDYKYKSFEIDISLSTSISHNIDFIRKIGYLQNNGYVNENSSLSKLDYTEDTFHNRVMSEIKDITQFCNKYNWLNVNEDIATDDIVIKHDNVLINNIKSLVSDNLIGFNESIDCMDNVLINNIKSLDSDNLIGFNESIDCMANDASAETSIYIRKHSLVVFFNNITKELVIVENNKINNGWYSKFVSCTNKSAAILKTLNIEFIKFIHSDSTIKEHIIDIIKSQEYDSLNDIEETINEYCDKLTDISSIYSIKNVLHNNFKITNNTNKKVQFTDILNMVNDIIKKNNEKLWTIEKFKEIKYILPYVLDNIGLKKKRSSKGIMWYGIEQK